MMTDLLRRVSALIERALAIRMTVPEDTGHIELDGDLAERIVTLTAEACELAAEVSAAYAPIAAGDGEPPSPGSGEVAVLRAIGAEIANAMARQEIADVAFLGRHQLSEIKSVIASARSQRATWLLLAHYETALRRARKALVAIESAIREYEGLETIPRAWESIDDALEIRRVYGQFRRSVTRIGAAEKHSVRGILLAMVRRIAILRDRTIYPYLRIEDRREIRASQKRIQAWLERDATSAEHLRDGERLWQDLVGFAGLLSEVNRRETICGHDRDVIAGALRVVGRRSSAGSAVPPGILEEMQNLLGRDDELDDLLLDPRAAEDIAPWQRPLTRLLDELDQPFRVGD